MNYGFTPKVNGPFTIISPIDVEISFLGPSILKFWKNTEPSIYLAPAVNISHFISI